MKRILSSMFLAALMLALATGANAASFTLTPGVTGGSPVAGTIPGGVATNDFLGAGNLFAPLTTIGGYYGSTVNYNVVGIGASVTFEFFGGEAGFHNQFFYNDGSGYALVTDGITPFDHSGSPQRVIAPSLATPFSTKSFSLAAGSNVLPFEFVVNSLAGGLTGGPINGQNPLNIPGLPPNFFVACDQGQGLSATTPAAIPAPCTGVLYAFLDDNGANNDDNHDDLLVRITLTDGRIPPPPVPEPSSFALLGSGLIGLGLMARKVRK